jgi:hypothetical protein
MITTTAALQMAALAVAARACVQLGHGYRWSALVPAHVFGASQTTVDPMATWNSGTKRAPRRLEKRLT